MKMKEDLKNIVSLYSNSPRKLNILIKEEPLATYIINKTKFLADVKMIERVYCIVNDIHDKKKCMYCNEGLVNFKSFNKGYVKYCSQTCVGKASSTEEKKEKYKKSCLKKYGVENASKSEKVKNKKVETTLKNYGVDNPSRSKSIKKKKIETCLKNYGVEHPMMSKEVMDKSKETHLRERGVSHHMKTEKSMNAQKRTNLERYGVSHVMELKSIQKKRKETNLKRYGVEFPAKLDSVKKKSKETMLKNGTILTGTSKMSRDLFREILKIIKDVSKIYTYDNNGEYFVRNDLESYYAYDFVDSVNKKVIEFNGDVFHANPKRFSETDKPNPFNEMTSIEIWQKDKTKLDFIKNKEFEVLVVWEEDWLSDKNEVIRECLQFLSLD